MSIIIRTGFQSQGSWILSMYGVHNALRESLKMLHDYLKKVQSLICYNQTSHHIIINTSTFFFLVDNNDLVYTHQFIYLETQICLLFKLNSTVVSFIYHYFLCGLSIIHRTLWRQSPYHTDARRLQSLPYDSKEIK